MPSRLLPLFPLQVVVFPRTQLPLHIFEERYKVMIGEAIAKNTEFGIVLAKDDGIVNAGCTVVVDKVLKTYPDGRMDIVARGRRRFEIVMLNQEKDYLQGEVEFFDDDEPGIFDETLQFLQAARIASATFNILTPYPGTALYARMNAQQRLLHRDWDLYDTRHAVFRPRKMTPEQLEEGYWRAYRAFYRWPAILRGALTKPDWAARMRHFAYAAGWKKFEPLWDLVLRAKRVAHMRPLLEAILDAASGTGRDETATIAEPRPRLASIDPPSVTAAPARD